MAIKEQMRQERLAMISDWQQSGQSRQEWCRAHGVAYHVFQYWYRQWRRPVAADGKFIPVEVSPAGGGAVELLLPDGRRVVFHQPLDVAYLKALLF
jgi:hypothetical protein